ncbi:hypothetical protein GCM10009557_38880 [Virgisporangium ochraceum]|uniref:DUF4082 domain-containing protein n=1 Tax=Virgisporangium ochraceum TaxID=65505 RepID=A0A8J3ZYX1_9ACTN|nr:hypothetical protein Voc01_059720 [Virgisporangium ochraceum]
MLAAGIVAGQPASAEEFCPHNAIVCENQNNAGVDDTEWDDIHGAGDSDIQGFTTDISVNRGGTVEFKVSTVATAYRVDIYRIGWYGGKGARKVHTLEPDPALAQDQDDCVTDPDTEIYDCGTWRVSATWSVPATAVSGVYVAKLVRTDGESGTSHMIFVVRDDTSTSDLFFQTSDATWQAYNDFGGSNFYWGGPQGRALKVSYNRPFATRRVENGRDWFFSNEYPMIRFLERNGYDISYTTDVDSDRRGNLIRNHRTFLSVGHDEYWSAQQRSHVEAARDAGVNLAFFTGNEVYWKTRWESSVDGAGTPYRTLVCYKETWADRKLDESTTEWTGTWRDPRFSPPSDGGRPENALVGNLYMSNNTDLAIQVPAQQGRNRFWRNTSVAAQNDGDTATLAPHTVGYESNEDHDNGFRPPGLFRLSTTTGPTPEYLQDFGRFTDTGTTTHHVTMYRATSGALVFGAGTIQWAWGLDDIHDGIRSAPDEAMQQATVNLLADMGAQPTTLMSGLDPATMSTDFTAPSVTVTSPANGTSVANGAAVTVSGTAVDAGSGEVAGVEVSTDGGTTWHPATGTSAWSYTFHSNGPGSQVVKVRAVDDSGNLGQTPATLGLTLTGPSTLFGQRVPAHPATDDSGAVTLGVKVVPQTDGTITGVRFYKGTGNGGTHTGQVWSADGQLLRTGTFTDESASGWQTLQFSQPLPVTAGTTYVASYLAPNGHYAADERFFSSLDHVAAPLVAPRGRTSGGNGLFRPGAGFPVEASSRDVNYYVDVMFVDGGAAPSVLTTSPVAGATGVAVDARPGALFSRPVAAASVQFTVTDGSGAPVSGATGYDAPTRTATFTPAVALAYGEQYTATVTATGATGTPMDAPATWTFTTSQYEQVSTLFGSGDAPAVTSSGDTEAITLGVRFTPTVDGEIVGVRFWRGAGNTGPHTGTLYSADGDELARATFPAASGTGWQSVEFGGPVEVTAGTTYVVAYYAPNGNYAVSSGFFGTGWTNGDGTLTAPAGSNGVYRYGSDGFPTGTYNSTNYWVDAMFVPDGPPPGPPTPPSPPPGSQLIFGPGDTPAATNWDDTDAVELGVRFSSTVAGTVAGVRFHKGSQNTGSHTGSLWSPTGERMATGTFVESADGWQTLLFATPVAIDPGVTYTVSYHTTVGRYSLTAGGFAEPVTRGPLTATGSVYRYGSGGEAPTTASTGNYWVDVVLLET